MEGLNNIEERLNIRLTAIDGRLNGINERLNDINDRVNSVEKASDNKTDGNLFKSDVFEIGLISSMAKYLDNHYVKNERGRLPTTSFHTAIIEAMKQEGFNTDTKTLGPLMAHVFGFNKIKSCGDWYYVGLGEK